MRTTALKKYEEKLKKNQSTSQDEKFVRPDRNQVTGMSDYEKYNKLNEDGYVPEETEVFDGEMVIGKVTPIEPGTTGKVYKDSSHPYKGTLPATVDKVLTGVYDSEGYEIYKVRMRSERRPNIGDKFASRFSQKGTVGMLLHRADMPFTKEGIQPDLIINSHCIPSRGTIGHILEMVASKYGAIEGHRIDATTFEPVNMDEIRKGLKTAGYEEHGYETLYNGMTGIKMRCKLFIGPCYYMRLKHMVNDKIHCLDYETEILTIQGWKFINDLTMENDIATLNVTEMKVESYKPIEILKYPDFEGLMYYIKNDYIDMVITEEHRVLINDNNEYKLVPINTLLGKKFRFVKEINLEVDIDMTTDLIIKYEKKPVFCLTIPNEIFYVRRNYKTNWTGNSRSRGPMTLLTRQPPEGRSKDGGLRFGEMERDAIISYGASLFLKERFMELSDIYQVKVCNTCGLFASKMINKNVWGCSGCKNYTDISLVEMPYAFKLMIQELQAINILPRIRTKNTIYTDGN
jgi:DNA-directed RNA polymerase beta subunit